jgi:hypothetical protein
VVAERSACISPHQDVHSSNFTFDIENRDSIWISSYGRPTIVFQQHMGISTTRIVE